MRKAYLQGRALLAVSRSVAPEAAVPNLRSILEAYGELHFLLEHPQRTTQAQVAFAYALHELENFLSRWDDLPEELERVRRELLRFRAAAPDATAIADMRNNYWTVKGRAALVEDAVTTALRTVDANTPPDNGQKLYKLLSWDERHVMATLLSIGFGPGPESGTIIAQGVRPARGVSSAYGRCGSSTHAG